MVPPCSDYRVTRRGFERVGTKLARSNLGSFCFQFHPNAMNLARTQSAILRYFKGLSSKNPVYLRGEGIFREGALISLNAQEVSSGYRTCDGFPGTTMLQSCNRAHHERPQQLPGAGVVSSSASHHSGCGGLKCYQTVRRQHCRCVVPRFL